ncbi:hypothetical protein NPIL_1691 [Nephila pilipes]|uniref:Uncharacterized protein n=1 Tax=Nephila pilipes TaxID=299642 RepID=A0A8X6QJQ8_NEPPI|nr:hypothetical protein NPIL_1691 [Nephila pilipes]
MTVHTEENRRYAHADLVHATVVAEESPICLRSRLAVFERCDPLSFVMSNYNSINASALWATALRKHRLSSPDLFSHHTFPCMPGCELTEQVIPARTHACSQGSDHDYQHSVIGQRNLTFRKPEN